MAAEDRIVQLLFYAEQLPSRLNDARAAEKLLA